MTTRSSSRSPQDSTRSTGDAPLGSVLTEATNIATQAKIGAAIKVYLDTYGIHTEAQRNFVKGLTEGMGIDRNKFNYELRKKKKQLQEEEAAAAANAENIPPPDLLAHDGTRTNDNYDLPPPLGDRTAQDTDDDSTQDDSQKKNGRPKGSTKAAKKEKEERKKNATHWAVERLKVLAADETKIDSTGKWKHGVLTSLANEAKKQFNIDADVEIKPDTIRKRYDRKSNRSSKGPKSIMDPLEPLLVTLCIAMQRILIPLKE